MQTASRSSAVRDSPRDSGQPVAPRLVLGLQGPELGDGRGPPLGPRAASADDRDGREPADGLAGGEALAVSPLALGGAHGHACNTVTLRPRGPTRRHLVHAGPHNFPTRIRAEIHSKGWLSASSPGCAPGGSAPRGKGRDAAIRLGRRQGSAQAAAARRARLVGPRSGRPGQRPTGTPLLPGAGSSSRIRPIGRRPRAPPRPSSGKAAAPPASTVTWARTSWVRSDRTRPLVRPEFGRAVVRLGGDREAALRAQDRSAGPATEPRVRAIRRPGRYFRLLVHRLFLDHLVQESSLRSVSPWAGSIILMPPAETVKRLRLNSS